MAILPRSCLLVLLLLAAFCPTPAASSSSPAPRSCMLPAGIALTLHLEAGTRMPPGTYLPNLMQPRDMPPGPVSLRLPLYPGAVPTRETVLTDGFQSPGSNYLKSAWAEEWLPAQSASAAWTWYRGEFAACGYDAATSAGYSAVVLPPSGWVTLTVFTSRRNKHVQVQLTLQRDPWTGHLVALYFALDDDIPPRAAGSYLPADVVKARIATWYYPAVVVGRQATASATPAPTPPPYYVTTVTISDPAALAVLVHAINSLTDIWPAESGCTAGPDFATTLVFSRRNGQQITVHDDPNPCAGVIVDGYDALQDPSNVVWNAIAALVYPQGTPTPNPIPAG